jgi:phosphoglycolate phosphatase-like HAD superfamily hydrolase
VNRIGDAARPGNLQTTVTGNVRGAARIKLAAFGLDTHLDLGIGAYGEDRAELVRTAIGRASTKSGTHLHASEAVLIGDTPADIEAGKETSVFVIAVATSRTPADELRQAGADAVLDDLTGTGRLVGLISATRS